jgi:hypothetical protein
MRSKRGTMQVVVVEMVDAGAEGGSRTRTSLRTTDFKSLERPFTTLITTDFTLNEPNAPRMNPDTKTLLNFVIPILMALKCSGFSSPVYFHARY